ncbi:unnamed protein product [Peniophora sp. CBMAI 1063]|nr:unnamed protein product [Peniophora sp. CBMAI 1063]
MGSAERLGVLAIFSPPSKKELVACWELTRLGSAMGPSGVVFYPLVFSMAMAYRAKPEVSALEVLGRLAMFWILSCGVKAFLMTADDILDADIDAKVTRTQNRAIPRGDITILRASMFLILQAVIGTYLANTFLKPYTVKITAPTWPLFLIYPTCKRWMSFAPIVLGLMFNSGVFMGWSDLSPDGRVPWNVLSPIYVGCCFWVIAYETVYQHLDREEDVKLGIKSFAIFCGEYTNVVCGASSLCFTGLLAYGASLNGHGPILYAALAAVTLQLLYGIAHTDVNVRSQCWYFFLLTPRIGAILVTGFITDVVFYRWMNGLAL